MCLLKRAEANYYSNRILKGIFKQKNMAHVKSLWQLTFKSNWIWASFFLHPLCKVLQELHAKIML